MKKVLINYLGRMHSGPVFSIEFARAMANNGYDVYAIISSYTVNRDEWLNEKKFKEVYLIDTYNSNIEFFVGTLKLFFLYKKRIKNHYKNIEFDYLIRPFYHPWTNAIDNEISAKKVITVCHDPIMHSGANRILFLPHKKFIKKSDIVVVLTKSFIPIVKDRYKIETDKIYFMPHPLLSIYKTKQDITKKKKQYTGNINFLFFGRIEKYKGIDILVDAFERLSNDIPNITLTIAGKGKLSNENKFFGKNISLVNEYIPDEEVGNFFEGDNVIVVLPYLDATQSGVIPIAMEYGTPVIASDTGGLKEQLNDGTVGIFAEAGSVDDLYQKMKYVVENMNVLIEEREKMLNYSENLKWDKVVGDLLDEIQNND